MKFIFTTIFIISITFGISANDEIICSDPLLKIDDDFQDFTETLAKDCSLESINKTYESGSNLRKFAKLEKKDLCKCLDGSKFMVAKVDNKRKKAFERGELDRTIADKMKEDFNNLASQFILFENFSQTKTHLGNILDESEIKKAGGVCNIQTLEDDIVKLEKNKNCKAPKGFFRDRLKTIFGNSSPENIWDVTKDKLNESDKNSCISKSRYLDMRSSAGASDEGFKLLESNSSIKNFRGMIDSLPQKDKNRVKDLLSYNVVFNMAYRDSTFFHEVKGRLVEIQKSGKTKYDLFQDPVLLQKAYTSMNRSCNLFSRAVKHYLCTDKNPTLHPSIMSAHLEDYFSKEKISDAEKKANTDYFTWQYSCNPLGAEKIYRTGWDKFKGIFTESIPKDKKTSNEEAFERYVERSVMIKTVTKPTIDENNPQTDYAKFNKMFCGKENLKINDSYAISQKMSEYLKSLQSKGTDISSVLGNKALQKKLGLGIELEYASVKFSVNDPNDIANDKLPHISPDKWDSVMAPELKKKGLSDDEIYQLYTLVEMQTNRVYTEMEDLKSKLVSTDPRFKDYSLSQIKKHTEGFYGEMTAEQKKDAEIIQNRHIAQKYDARMDVGYSQKLLMGEATTTQVKNEAIAYNQNLGTFDNRYVSQTNETTQDTKNIATNTSPSTPPEYKFGSGKNPNEGQDNFKPSGTFANNSKPSNTNQSSTSTVSEVKEEVSSETVKTSSENTSNNQVASSTPTAPVSNYIPSNPAPIASVNDPYPGMENNAVTNRPERRIASKEEYVPDEDVENPEIAELRKQVDEELKRARDYREQLANKNKPVQNNSVNDFTQTPQFDNSQNQQFAFNNRSTPANNQISSPTGEDATLSDETASDSEKLKESGKKSKSPSGSKHSSTSDNSDAPDVASLEASGAGNLSPKSLGSIKSSLPDGFLNGESSKETDDELRKRLGLSEFQYPRYIPHKLMEIEEIKTPERLVMLMGLYGKEFKTIEVLQVSTDPNSAIKETKYVIHTYDFRPEGKLEEYKEDLETPEKRSILARKFENLDNLESGHHAVEVARSTKEVQSGEITKTEADKLKKITLKFEDARKIYQERSGNIEKFYKKYEEVEERIRQRKARKNK